MCAADTHYLTNFRSGHALGTILHWRWRSAPFKEKPRMRREAKLGGIAGSVVRPLLQATRFANCRSHGCNLLHELYGARERLPRKATVNSLPSDYVSRFGHGRSQTHESLRNSQHAADNELSRDGHSSQGRLIALDEATSSQAPKART